MGEILNAKPPFATPTCLLVPQRHIQAPAHLGKILCGQFCGSKVANSIIGLMLSEREHALLAQGLQAPMHGGGRYVGRHLHRLQHSNLGTHMPLTGKLIKQPLLQRVEQRKRRQVSDRLHEPQKLGIGIGLVFDFVHGAMIVIK